MILSTSENANPNYLATIVKLEDLRPHENADKLQLAYVLGSTVVTGLDAKIGDIYVYFPVESAICKKFLSWANLFSDATLNSNTLKRGMFSKSGRVKMLRIRTIYSNGFILPFEIVQEYIRQVYKKDVELKVGHSFDSIGGDIFVQKYAVPVKIGTPRNLNKSKGNVKKFDKLVPMQHSFYPDTLNLRKVIGEELNPDDEIVISKKYHGTSGIVSNVLVYRQLTFWERFLVKFFKVKIPDKEYGLVAASRTVIKSI